MSPLRILHLEDNALDAELVREQLAGENIPCQIDRATSRDSFIDYLGKGSYDVIISDFSLPGFDGLAALEMAKLAKPDVPFIFLSGTIGEERSVESLKKGAVDYVLKDRLQRLPSAILRAREEAISREEQLRNFELLRRQAHLLNEARDAIFVCNLDQIVTYWSMGAERLYGWTASEIIGRKASKILYKSEAPQRDAIWQAVLKDGEWIGELLQITKTHKQITVASRRTLLRNSTGTPAGVLNINTDISEKKVLETQVLRSQRMDSIGALASGIAHDLNNVLAPILMTVELLRDEQPNDDCLRMLDIAKLSAQRGAELVQQILQFGRGSKHQEAAVDFKGLVGDIAKLISKTFPPGIHVETNVSDDLLQVLSDPTQIHQILLNLCVNARDAMRRGGTISIEVKNAILADRLIVGHSGPVSGPFVELSVRDTGTGIPPEIVGRIFDPFFTTKAEGKGTGLGLSTVATIVRNNRGFFDLSTTAGKGTTFRVFLPGSPQSKTVIKETQFEVTLGDGEWILLVDDELAILEMTKEILEAHNYQVLTASNGGEALACFEKHRDKISIVITDLLMPDISGNVLIADICGRYPNTITICLSGSANDESVLPDHAGDQAFLRKPCPTQDLLRTIEKLLVGRKNK